MIHRIVITGAESTGKTTLAKTLADHYGEPWTQEFVRRYVDQLNRPLQQSDLEAIAGGQFATEDDGYAQARKLVIHDTNILSSIIYAKNYFGVTLDWVNETFLKRNYNLYLLCLPDIPWEADAGQREGVEARDQLHNLFKTQLDAMKLPYVKIHGTRDERLRQATEAISKSIKDSSPPIVST